MDALLIQPGGYGDIFICAPIAKYYTDLGYKVHWPGRVQFKPLIEGLGYVTYIPIPGGDLHHDWLRSDVMKILPMVENYSLVLNLADRGPHPVAEQKWENFEQVKYRLAKVPFEKKYNLQWNRNLEKEEELYNRVVTTSPYIFAHVRSSKGYQGKVPSNKLPVVETREIEGYTIFDWYKVIKDSEVIYSTESSFQAFIDGFCLNLEQEKFLIPREAGGYNTTISEHWDKRYIS